MTPPRMTGSLREIVGLQTWAKLALWTKSRSASLRTNWLYSRWPSMPAVSPSSAPCDPSTPTSFWRQAVGTLYHTPAVSWLPRSGPIQCWWVGHDVWPKDRSGALVAALARGRVRGWGGRGRRRRHTVSANPAGKSHGGDRFDRAADEPIDPSDRALSSSPRFDRRSALAIATSVGDRVPNTSTSRSGHHDRRDVIGRPEVLNAGDPSLHRLTEPPSASRCLLTL